jgi:aminopeptidase N
MIAASPSWSSVDLGVWDGVAVELWDMPGADLAAEIDRERDSGFMAFLQQTFGPYPYGDRMRLFAAPMTWGGYEHPGVIAMNATLTGPAFANTLHHEIAHMWAGDQTTIASIRDFVWKEATAEYLTFVYAEQSGDEQRAREKLQAWHSQALNSTVHAVPGEPLELVDFYGEVYSQGPLVLYRQIEAMFGRDKVITALQSVLGRPRVLSVDELRIALEAATGANLEAYFRRWVNGTGTPARPIFDVSVVNHRHEVTVAVRQPEQPDPFGCAFSVRLQAADGQTFDVRFDLGPSGQLEAVQSVSAGFAVVAAQFDPELECLARASVTIQ